MNAVLQWIEQNPSAIKSLMVSVLALVGKGIIAFSGKEADLGAWAGFVDQAINVLVGALTIYGVFGSILHISRGPALTTTDQAATIIAALAPAHASAALETVKVLSADIAAVKPLLTQTETGGHKF